MMLPMGANTVFSGAEKYRRTATESTDWDAVEAGYVSVSRVFAQPVTASGGPEGQLLFRV